MSRKTETKIKKNNGERKTERKMQDTKTKKE